MLCKVLGAHILCVLVPWINLKTINGWKTCTRNRLFHQRRQERTPPMDLPIHWQDQLASYPGVLIPAFVACTTNMGEGLVKLSHVVWCTWACGGVAHSQEKQQVSEYATELQTQTVERLSTRHQTVLATFLGFRSCYTTVQKECATPPHIQVRHTTWLGFTRPSIHAFKSLFKWTNHYSNGGYRMWRKMAPFIELLI